MMFWNKKPKPVPGTDAEMVEKFRVQFNRMRGHYEVLKDRGIAVTLSHGEDRGYHSVSPDDLRIEEIKRIRLETF